MSGLSLNSSTNSGSPLLVDFELIRFNSGKYFFPDLPPRTRARLQRKGLEMPGDEYPKCVQKSGLPRSDHNSPRT